MESNVLNVKAVVGAFNQEKALVGAFSMIVKTNGPQDVCQDREGAHEGDGAHWQKSGSKHRRNVSFKFIQGAKLVVKYNLLNH